MAVPIFQQYMQALASGNDVNTITPELLASVRTANNPIVTLPQGYAPDFSNRSGAIGGLARLFTDPSNRNVNPALFSGLTRPTSDATKAVDLRNRNAEIQRQNAAMVNAISNFGGSGRTSENIAGAVLEDADLRMPNFGGSGSTSENMAGVTLRDADLSGASNYLNKSLASMQGSLPRVPDLSQYIPEVSQYIPDLSQYSTYDAGRDIRNAPGDIASALMYPVNQASIALENAGTAILDSDLVGGITGREEGTTYTGNKALAAAKLIEKAKVTNPSDPTNAAKTIAGVQGTVPKVNTTAIKGTADDDTNWFDAVNERVDLMAMGAAMLAGSGSGMGTAANLGQALQAGIGSRKSEATAAEAKAYKDKLLTLEALKAQSAMRKNNIAAAAARLGKPFENEGAKINAITAQLRGANIEGEDSDLKEIATLINATDYRFVMAPQDIRSDVLNLMAKEYGSNFFSDGGELDITEVRKAYLESVNSILGTK